MIKHLTTISPWFLILGCSNKKPAESQTGVLLMTHSLDMPTSHLEEYHEHYEDREEGSGCIDDT